MGESGLSCEAVRQRILTEHGRLREAVGEVTAARSHAQLTLAAQALLDLLAEHLAHEDDLLAPVLRTIDAWGGERERRLRAEHGEQRAEIARIRSTLAQPFPIEDESTLASVLRQFVDRLRSDMALEERDVLTPDLLRDDAITVEFGG
jgi:iron-sulfur cluster repair protein YtfE (RIC family)